MESEEARLRAALEKIAMWDGPAFPEVNVVGYASFALMTAREAVPREATTVPPRYAGDPSGRGHGPGGRLAPMIDDLVECTFRTDEWVMVPVHGTSTQPEGFSVKGPGDSWWFYLIDDTGWRWPTFEKRESSPAPWPALRQELADERAAHEATRVELHEQLRRHQDVAKRDASRTRDALYRIRCTVMDRTLGLAVVYARVMAYTRIALDTDAPIPDAVIDPVTQVASVSPDPEKLLRSELVQAQRALTHAREDVASVVETLDLWLAEHERQGHECSFPQRVRALRNLVKANNDQRALLPFHPEATEPGANPSVVKMLGDARVRNVQLSAAFETVAECVRRLHYQSPQHPSTFDECTHETCQRAQRAIEHAKP